VGLYNPTGGSFFLRNSHGGGAADVSLFYGPANVGWLPLAGDWDGNGVDTVALYSRTSGTFFQRNTNTPGVADNVFAYGPSAIAGPDIPASAADARDRIEELLDSLPANPAQPIVDLVLDYQEDVQERIESGDRRSLGRDIRQLAKQLATDIRAAQEELVDSILELHQDWLNR
jgi:hypothetical protein